MAIRLRTVALHAWLWTLAALVSLMILIGIGLGFLLGTERGRLMVLEQAEVWLPRLTGQTLVIEGAEVPSLGDWRLPRVEWRAGASGPAVEVTDARLQFRPRYLLQGRLWIDALTASSVRVEIPESTEVQAPQQEGGSDPLSQLQGLWPRIPPIRFERLDVEQFSLELADRSPLRTTIEADAQVNWGSWPARLNLALSEGDNSQLSLGVSVDAVNALRVTGGIQASSDSLWASWLDWPLTDDMAGQWDLNLSVSEGGYEADILTLTLPWRGYQLSALGAVSFNPTLNRVFLSELALSADDHAARLHGFLEADQADLTIEFDDLPLGLLNGLVPIDDLDGRLAANGRLTGGWRSPRFAGETAFTGTLKDEPLSLKTVSRATTEGLTLESADLSWGEARLSTRGNIQWAQSSLDLQLEWQDVSDTRWQPWVPGWPSDLSLQTSGSGRLSGALTDPTLTASARVEGQYREQSLELTSAVELNRRELALNGLALNTPQGRIDGHARLGFSDLSLSAGSRLDNVRSSWLDVLGVTLPVEQNWGVTGRLEWDGTLIDPRAVGDLTVVGQWQRQPMTAALRVDEVTLRHLDLGDSRLTLAQTQARVAGRVDWQQQRLDLTTGFEDLSLTQLSPFVPALPAWMDGMSGRLRGDLSVVGPWQAPQVSGTGAFSGTWRDRPLAMALDVDTVDRESWRVRSARLNWGDLAVSYQGELRPFDPALDGRFTVTNLSPSDLSVLPVSWPPQLAELQGRAQATGTISGPLTAPIIAGSAGFDGQYQDTDLSLDATIDYLDPEQVQLASLTVQSDPARLSAEGRLTFSPLSFDVRTELANVEWQQIAPWVPPTEGVPLETLSATASGQLSLVGAWPRPQVDGRLSVQGNYLEAPFDVDWRGQGRLSETLSHALTLTWGATEVTADLDTAGERIDGQLNVAGVEVAQLRALGVPLGADVSGSGSADIGVSGTLIDPVIDASVTADGLWQPLSPTFGDPTDWSIRVDAAGQWAEWRIEQGRADLGPAGDITVTGSGSRTRLDLTAELDVPELRYWLPESSPWVGRFGGRIQVVGTPEAPDVSADLSWESNRFPLALSVDARTTGGRHRLQARLTEDGNERLALDVSTAQTPLAAWGGDLSQRRFEADVSVDTDARALSRLVQQQADQEFSGHVSGRLSIVGSLAEPEWEGEARMREGRYENANYGAVLSDIRANLTASTRTLTLSLTAGDDNVGRLSLDGSVNWPEDRNQWWMPELDLTLDTRSARLVRRADIDATVSGGLAVAGPWRDLMVTGELEVMPLTIKLASFLESGVASLNVIRASDAANVEAVDRVNPYAPQGQWRVRIRADRRAQIYGAGLEAELSGEVDLTGDLTAPDVGGRFEVIRGTYTAFGKIFRIEDGTVQVQGTQILLDINAVYTGRDITVDLRITGNQNRLELTMTPGDDDSTSPSSNDELLARLLFGKSIEEMSAVQALQLAAALNSLRNPGSGLDLFGTTRDLLGLDALTIDSGTNEEGETGVNVQAGKYISDRLYLQVESGVRTEDSFNSSLQYFVTPNVNFEFYTNGQLGSGGVELNWSNDY